MSLCRTCLKTPAETHISELKKSVKEDNKNCFEIIMFCLDIEVTRNSAITTNLCSNCYRKIIAFYKFKTLSQKNDSYLKSLEPVPHLDDQKLSVYVDENGIKHENLLDTDEFGPSLIECCDEKIKLETEVQSDNSNHVFEDIEADVKDNNSFEIETSVNSENVLNDAGAEEKALSDDQNVKNKHNKKRSKGNGPIRVRVKKAKLLKKEKGKPTQQVCEECGLSFSNIREHLLRHKPKEERQTLQCDKCPKTFLTIGGKKQHYRITHLGLRSKCEICGKVVAILKSHMEIMHNPEQLPYACVQCPRRFVARSLLDGHMITHTKDLQFECDLCHKMFGSKSLVTRHILYVHQKVRSHQCQYCPKTFFRLERLTAHVRSHTNERPYKCEECGKAFATANYLKDHCLTHGKKSFHCTHCDMSFAKLGNMKSHMVKHTKEKRYPCRFCGVRFGRSDHRNRHEFTAHKKQRGD